MVTVHREAGFRVVIFTDDHEPAHVHVYGDGAANIILIGADGQPKLVSADGMKRGDVRKAMRIVTGQRDFLMECWRKIHG